MDTAALEIRQMGQESSIPEHTMAGVLYLNFIAVTQSFVILDEHMVENKTVVSLMLLEKNC